MVRGDPPNQENKGGKTTQASGYGSEERSDDKLHPTPSVDHLRPKNFNTVKNKNKCH